MSSRPTGKKNPPKKYRGKKKFGAAAAPTKIVVKPKVRAPTAKGRRILAEREPKVFEDTKMAMFVRGKNTGPLARDAMGDLYHLKMPFAVKYKRKNDITPFEDPTSLEFFSSKSDAALLLFCNHNKKRPNNMIFARFFDSRLLDMIEVGVDSYMPMVEFGEKPLIGAKPAIVLRGSAFETDANVSAFGNLLIDFFRGTVTDEMNLEGLSHVIVVTAMDNGTIHFRVYMTKLKKSGTKLPHVELEECGPRIDWSMRRQQLADRDLRRRAMQQPLQALEGKPKNITKTALGDRVGRIHMEKQEFQGFQTRKMKGLKKRRTTSGEQVTDAETPAALAPNDS